MGLTNDTVAMSGIMPCFNELTATGFSEENVVNKVQTYVEVLKKLDSYGIKKVLYDTSFKNIVVSRGLSLADVCDIAYYDSRFASLRTVVNVLMQTRQYPSEVEKNKRFDLYSQVELVRKEEGEEVRYEMPFGLYAAYLLNSFAIGFVGEIDAESVNITCSLQLTKQSTDENKEDGTEMATVYNITRVADFDDDDFSSYLAAKDIDVPKAEQKNTNIDLPPHHSFYDCREHAKSLIRDDYVVEILDSLPFRRDERKYIHKVHDDGKLEVRIFWVEGGYGLKIQTSGKDIVHTKWIANHLAERYGHM